MVTVTVEFAVDYANGETPESALAFESEGNPGLTFVYTGDTSNGHPIATVTGPSDDVVRWLDTNGYDPADYLP